MQTQSETTDAVPGPHQAPKSPRCPFARRGGSESAAAVARWRASGDADNFPYEAVVAAFHRVGKHFVAASLLEDLAAARADLPGLTGSAAGVWLLARFLDAALDKRDGRYANPTYLALGLLPLHVVGDPDRDVADAERRYDRLLVRLIADALHFEVAAAEGRTSLLPRMRPDARTTAKRCRLGLQVAGPAMRRLGMADGVAAPDPTDAARRLWAAVAVDLSPEERRTLELTMLPVSLVHDEYQFIRVLQAYEATFALVAVQLHAAVEALTDGRPDVAPQRIDAAEAVLREAAPLFSLVGTMQVAAFQTFREFTEGASAIQSRNYKLVESLCRQPEPSRLDSVAYRSTPEVRRRVLAGQQTLDEALVAARDGGRLDRCTIVALEGAMRRFAATLGRWRRTHYRLAVRMLGERTGTGYTEGSPYLKAAQTIPVFPSLAAGEDIAEAESRDADGGDGSASMSTAGYVGAGGRCPFAAEAFPSP